MIDLLAFIVHALLAALILMVIFAAVVSVGDLGGSDRNRRHDDG